MTLKTILEDNFYSFISLRASQNVLIVCGLAGQGWREMCEGREGVIIYLPSHNQVCSRVDMKVTHFGLEKDTESSHC